MAESLAQILVYYDAEQRLHPLQWVSAHVHYAESLEENRVLYDPKSNERDQVFDTAIEGVFGIWSSNVGPQRLGRLLLKIRSFAMNTWLISASNVFVEIVYGDVEHE